MEKPEKDIVTSIMEIQRVCLCLSVRSDRIISETIERVKANYPSCKIALSEAIKEC